MLAGSNIGQLLISSLVAMEKIHKYRISFFKLLKNFPVLIATYSHLSPCGHLVITDKIHPSPRKKLYIEVWLKMTPAITDSKLRPEGVRYNES